MRKKLVKEWKLQIFLPKLQIFLPVLKNLFQTRRQVCLSSSDIVVKKSLQGTKKQIAEETASSVHELKT
jgi:hypothetical protein